MDLMTQSTDVTTSHSDGARDADSALAGSSRGTSNTEVLKPRRRTFTSAFKIRVLREADGCRKPGELGALLRREGLYSSHLTKWREQRDQGTLTRSAAIKRGPKPDPDKALAREIEKLRRETAQLRRKLERAELIIAYQKKVADLLGTPFLESDSRSGEGENS